MTTLAAREVQAVADNLRQALDDCRHRLDELDRRQGARRSEDRATPLTDADRARLVRAGGARPQ